MLCPAQVAEIAEPSQDLAFSPDVQKPATRLLTSPGSSRHAANPVDRTAEWVIPRLLRQPAVVVVPGGDATDQRLAGRAHPQAIGGDGQPFNVLAACRFSDRHEIGDHCVKHRTESSGMTVKWGHNLTDNFMKFQSFASCQNWKLLMGAISWRSNNVHIYIIADLRGWGLLRRI